MINIREPDSHPQAGEIRALKELRKRELASPPFSDCEIELRDHELLEPYSRIVDETREKFAATADIWLDITTLPKRFFFPMIKVLLRSGAIENLTVAYTLAGSYGDGKLHRDIQNPEFLPLFQRGLSQEKVSGELVVSIGFESSGVIQIIEQNEFSPVTVLFPYPAPPPAFARNWDFVRFAAKSIPAGFFKMQGISFIDVPAIFELFSMRAPSAKGASVFAPFGPKPVSLAMCLYAVSVGNEAASVMYSQPKFYSPTYSLGVKEDAQGPVMYGYPVVIDGLNRYS